MKDKIHQTLACEYKLYSDVKISEDLQDFIKCMLEYNEKHNLTSITEENDIIYKHLLDSLLPIEMFDKNLKVLDIGCGAGFPSIPLAIANRELNITAIDSVKKKVEFVEIVKEQLNLINLTANHVRIEDYASKDGIRESFDVVVSRAVAPLNIILEYSAPMLKNGGYIYAYKGLNYENEIEDSKNALKVLDCSVELVKEYYVKELETTRYLIKIKKHSSISPKYPRKQNKPRIKPL